MTREPNQVGTRVEVEGNRGGVAKGKGQSIVAARGERERDLLVAVTLAEAGGGASGGGFEEVVGGGELGFGKGVG